MPTKNRIVDYQEFTNIDTPKSERRRLGVGDVWSNAAECLECGQTVRSCNRHDFRSCRCGNLSVDGGSWYCKRTYVKVDSYIDKSVPYNDVKDEEWQ